MLRKFYNDIFKGWKLLEGIYAISLVLFQVLFYVLFPDSPIGFLAGVTGTICVLLVAKGRISNFFFGLIQVFASIFLARQYGLIGEQWENIFYLGAQVVGIFTWKNNISKETKSVIPRTLTLWQWIGIIGAIGLSTYALGSFFLAHGGNYVWLDASTLAIALIATGLQVFRFKEQWILWMCLNVISIYQFSIIGNMSIVALYIAFLINTLYGYYNWSKTIAIAA